MEQNHRTIKKMADPAARTGCDMLEMVRLYNFCPKVSLKKDTAPSMMIY
jgi:hypothetical protein